MTDSHFEQPPLPFTDEDYAHFEAEDIVAGRMIVSLMTAIFCVGLLIYCIVLWSVM